MKSFGVEIVVAAPAVDVWSVLTDAARYTQWNSTVERVDGTITDGGRITVYARISPGRAFPLTVGQWEPARRMTWSGGMPFGLFTGTRTFTLESGPTGTRFAMREVYSGLLAPLIARSIPDLQPAFERFAADLKVHLEQGAQ